VATIQDDYACTGVNPTVEKYTFPTAGASSYSSMGSPATTYQIVPFSSDYRASDTATTLNSASDVVIAIGGKSACPAMSDPGGAGTYYASVIYAAQSALVAEQAAYPGSKNVLILISDGDAGTTSTDLPGASTTSGVYPSTINQCQQAVTAAQAAASAGTKVYAVAYGAESSGCSSDSPAITPCQTMQQIASAAQNFFSDYGQSGSGIDATCVSAAQPTSNLNQIFTDIAGDLTVARLIPNGTT
jgi:hypothetical protein